MHNCALWCWSCSETSGSVTCICDPCVWRVCVCARTYVCVWSIGFDPAVTLCMINNSDCSNNGECIDIQSTYFRSKCGVEIVR